MAHSYSYPEVIEGGVVFSSLVTIQKDVENSLPALLNKQASEIKTIVVVGAWHGDEVVSFLKLPNAEIFCFEPDPENFAYLSNRFRGNPRVKCFALACGSSNNTQNFYVTEREGNGSLLKPQEHFGAGITAEISIKTVRLDSLREFKNRAIDLLWADVQGYELEVVKGAASLLSKCGALFLEVGEDKHYERAVSYGDLQEYLGSQGFVTAAEGLTEKGSGNVLFMPVTADLSKIFIGVPKRTKKNIRKEYWRKKLTGVGFGRILPGSLKLKVKKLIGW